MVQFGEELLTGAKDESEVNGNAGLESWVYPPDCRFALATYPFSEKGIEKVNTKNLGIKWGNKFRVLSVAFENRKSSRLGSEN